MATNLRVGVSIGAVLSSGFRSAFGSARSTVDRLGQTADSLGRRHERLGQIMARAMSHPTRNVGALRQQYEQLGRTLEQVRNRQERLAASQARGAALADARKGVRGQILETAGHGIAFAAPVVASVKTAMGFEAAMSKVKALSGATAEQMDLLRGQARELGKSTQFSATDAAAGQSFLSMAGWTPESIKAAMPSMLDLAAAGGIDVATAANISSNIMSGFEIAPEQAGRAADVLAKAATSANVDLGMLGETMKYAGPNALKLGVSMEQAAVMAGLMGNAGIQGSNAGTALRGAFGRLADPPKAAADALAQFGIATKDAQGNMRDMPELLKEIAEKTKDMGSGDRMGWLSKVFGLEASSAFAVLLDSADNGELDKKITELENSAGSANRIATAMNDNAQGSLTAMKSALEGTAISIGNVFLPMVRDIAGYVGSAAGALDSFATGNPEVIKSVVLVGGALLGLKMGFLAVKYGALLVMGPLNSVATGYHLVRSKLLLLKAASQGGTFTRLTGRFRTLGQVLNGNVVRGAVNAGRAMMTMGQAALMNPVGLAIAAIAVSAFLLIKYWQPIKAFFTGLWQGLKEGLAPVTEAFSSAFSAWAGVLSPLKPLWDGMSGAIGTAFGWLGKLFKPLNATSEQLEGATSAGKRVGLMLAGLIGFFPRLISGFFKFGADLISGPVDAIKSAVSTVKGVFTRVGSSVKSALAGIWSEISAGMSGGIGGVAKLIVNFSPLGLFYQAFAGVLSWFGVDLPKTFTEFGGNLISGLVNGIKDKLASAKESIVGFGSSVKGWFADTLGIKSPSRVFAGFGDNISEGVAVGLGRSKGVAAGGAAALALATTAAFGTPQLSIPHVDTGPQIASAYMAPERLPEQRQLIRQQVQPAAMPALAEQSQLVRQQVQSVAVPELTEQRQLVHQQFQAAEAPEVAQRRALAERVAQAASAPPVRAGAGDAGGMSITFSPTIKVSGSADPVAVRAQVTEATQLSFAEFERLMRRYESDLRRRSFSRN